MPPQRASDRVQSRISVLREILSWSKSCPTWQRDALRRLVQHGMFSGKDLIELTLICQSAHGFLPRETEVPASQPLSEEHLPPDVQSNQAVALTAIEAVQHVNALACKQTLPFGSAGLTVVYGDSASGKSSYGRILKCACRARSRPKRILPDVFGAGTIGVASATIKFKVGGQDDSHQWRDGETNRSPLASVSVFDSACALHYVEEANDVAFRPFGLDLLDKLASACTQLKRGFDQERTLLLATAKDFTDLKGPTDAGRLIESLTAQTVVAAVEKLANLSAQESEKLESLKRQVAQVEAEDPAVRARELKGRATRLDAMRTRLNEIQSALSEDGIQALKAALALANSTAAAANLASESAFKDEPPPLNGVGSETWERAVEELLLNGAVERFRRSIETQKLNKIADITAADIQTIEAAMDKCSTHLRGHDQPPAINQPVPAPAELQADIEQLENWVTQMRKRRS